MFSNATGVIITTMKLKIQLPLQMLVSAYHNKDEAMHKDVPSR